MRLRRTPRRRGRLERRHFWLAAVMLLCVALSPLEAQQARRPFRIGVLNAAWAASHPTVEGLKAGLKELGFEDGRDVTFDIRFTEGKLAAMPAAAAALVQAGVDLIFTSQEAATQAAKDATESVPIVFTLVGDPVGAGIVGKLAQPGGNVTECRVSRPSSWPSVWKFSGHSLRLSAGSGSFITVSTWAPRR